MFVVFQDGKRMSAFQPACCCSVTLPLRSVARKCCSSQVSLCHSTRRLVCCVPNGARSAPRNLTRHRLSAYSRDLLTPASLDSRLHQSIKRVFHNIHELSLFHLVLSMPVLHAQLFVVLGFTLRAWWRSCWLLLYVDPRQYIMTTTNLEKEAVQAR